MSRSPDEEGAVLIFVVVFLLVVSLVSVGLLSLSTTNMLATQKIKQLRAVDYAADADMETAIATVRISATEGYPFSTTPCDQPSLTVNKIAYRVDCYPIGAPPFEREVVLEVCPTSAPKPCDSTSPLRATVFFYDKPSVGSAVSVSTWSAVR